MPCAGKLLWRGERFWQIRPSLLEIRVARQVSHNTHIRIGEDGFEYVLALFYSRWEGELLLLNAELGVHTLFVATSVDSDPSVE